MADLPLVRLNSLCERITVGHVGSMRDQYLAEGIPFLRSKNISPFRLDLSDVKYVSPEFNRKLKKSALSPGDVVIVRTGYPGTAAVIPDDLPISNCADLVVITPGKNLDPRYLSAVFNSPWGKAVVGGRLVGVAQQHFNVTIAKQMEVPAPPLAVQRKIAAVLATHDELIENNLRRIEILEEMAQAIYREWFVNFRYPGHESVPLMDSPLGPIPTGWEAAMYGAFVDQVKEGIDPQDVSEGTAYVGLEHIPRQSFTLRDWSDLNGVTSRKWRFEDGDILFGRLRPYFHKVARAPLPGVCSTDAIVMRSQQSPEFALMTAFSKEFVDHAVATSGGTDRPRAKWDDLAAFELAMPTPEVLGRFADAVSPMIELAEILISANQNLRAIRDLLLPRLISGDLDVSDLDIDTSWLVA